VIAPRIPDDVDQAIIQRAMWLDRWASEMKGAVSRTKVHTVTRQDPPEARDALNTAKTIDEAIKIRLWLLSLASV